MFNPLHDEILAMILRQMKKYHVGQDVDLFTGGANEVISNPFTPTSPIQGGIIPGGESGGSSAFDEFNYKLLYNDDEELTGFTSNNGDIVYTLEKDIYEDLIGVHVQTSFATFIIALIFENYDVRIHSDFVEDKGKLTDVIIHNKIDNTFTLKVIPDSKTVVVGEVVQYTALVVLSDGTELDVTDEAEWAITAPSKIRKGIAVTTKVGTAVVTAIYMNEIASANLEIELPVDPVEPDNQIIPHDYNYKIVLRWEGSVDVDLDVQLSGNYPRIDINYANRTYESSNGLDKAWLDYDYVEHPDENDRQDKPEIITFAGFIGTIFDVTVSKYRGEPLTQNVTVDIINKEDSLIAQAVIPPYVFDEEHNQTLIFSFDVTSLGLSVNYTFTE